jgi:predicted NodU family carbamoyl transferase
MLTTQIHRELDSALDALIDEEQIVAIFQNHSEWGPRALGNRSIMFDPRHPNAKQIVNEVKKREYYRPFACTVMLEHAHDYFEMLIFLHSFMQTIHVEYKQSQKNKTKIIIILSKVSTREQVCQLYSTHHLI